MRSVRTVDGTVIEVHALITAPGEPRRFSLAIGVPWVEKNGVRDLGSVTLSEADLIALIDDLVAELGLE